MPQLFAPGIINVTGPVALQFRVDISEGPCEVTVSTESASSGSGLSRLVMHQEEGGQGVGATTDPEQTVIQVGPVDSRTGGGEEAGSSRVAWTMDVPTVITVALADARPQEGGMVDDGVVAVATDCHAPVIWTHWGTNPILWHTQTTDGTVLVGHDRNGVAVGRAVEGVMATERVLTGAFAAGNAVGTIRFDGPFGSEQVALPVTRLSVFEGGPGRYTTSLDTAGGTHSFGFILGLDPVES